MTGTTGIMLPKNEQMSAQSGGSGEIRTLLSANGIETRHSSPGMSETNITASHSQPENAEANDVSMISLLHIIVCKTKENKTKKASSFANLLQVILLFR